MLERQVNDKDERGRIESKLSREWSLNKSAGKQSQSHQLPERKRKINETSKQNAMVNLVSPSADIPSPEKNCCVCQQALS